VTILMIEDSLVNSPKGPNQNKVLTFILKCVTYIVTWYFTVVLGTFGIIPDRDKIEKVITAIAGFIIKHWVRILIIGVGTPFILGTSALILTIIFS